ncbi:hypothetical protein GWI33_022227 [Rhynchophorus ferrugineus]|uniref:Uncharacterized protein n=1 Tax=Rhynchophorus ferrugineus TaxID=354439 RepID=A0A834HM82_RHYFE|nr:hypothetical protein GWI33_022227 [Rhynchophorus ferrugineus]
MHFCAAIAAATTGRLRELSRISRPPVNGAEQDGHNRESCRAIANRNSTKRKGERTTANNREIWRGTATAERESEKESVREEKKSHGN